MFQGLPGASKKSFPLHCLGASQKNFPCLASMHHQRPPHPQCLLYSAARGHPALETPDTEDWAEAAAGFIFPLDPVGCATRTAGSPHQYQGPIQGRAHTRDVVVQVQVQGMGV